MGRQSSFPGEYGTNRASPRIHDYTRQLLLGYWDGHGFFPEVIVTLSPIGPGWMAKVESMVHRFWMKLSWSYSRLPPGPFVNVPRVTAENREYILFCGSLETVPSLSKYPVWGQSPNLWWPEARAWCVATGVDLHDTFVGGSESCIERILNCPDLEALPVTVDARIDWGADIVNT